MFATNQRDRVHPLITLAEPADAEAILRLQRLAYQGEAELYQDWNIPPLLESLAGLRAEFGRQRILKAIGGQPTQLVGSVRVQVGHGACLLGRLIVHPDFQGCGIGGQLVREAERQFPEARRFELFTGHRSARNLAIYQHLGYAPCREERLSDQVTLIFLQKIVARSQAAHS
jgi:predicted N-acetyltransferase YhbS